MTPNEYVLKIRKTHDNIHFWYDPNDIECAMKEYAEEKDKEIASLKAEINGLKLQIKDEFSAGYDYCKEYYKINDV